MSRSLIFTFLICFIFVSPSFSQDQPANIKATSTACFEDECLLCYLSQSKESDEVQKLISHYDLKPGVFGGFDNTKSGIDLWDSEGNITQIRINLKVFKGKVPFGIKLNDSPDDLIKKFGSSIGQFTETYEVIINQLVRMKVAYGLEPDYKAIKSLKFEALDELKLSSSCFDNGLQQEVDNNQMAILAFNFNLKLGEVLMTSLNNFEGADKVGLEGAQNFLIQEPEDLITEELNISNFKVSSLTMDFGTTTNLEEAIQGYEIIKKFVGNLKTNCFSLSPNSLRRYIAYAKEYEVGTYTDWEISYVSEGCDQEIMLYEVSVDLRSQGENYLVELKIKKKRVEE